MLEMAVTITHEQCIIVCELAQITDFIDQNEVLLNQAIIIYIVIVLFPFPSV